MESYMAAGGDPSSAAAAALALEEAFNSARRLAGITAPFDAFDVLENLRMSELVAGPENYRETEHERSAAALELSALVLASRGHRAGSAPDEDGFRARSDSVIEEARQLAHDALTAGTTALALRAIGDAGPGTSMSLGVLLREVHVRNVAYPHMVEETLAALFDHTSVEADCVTAMGCTVRDILTVFGALQRLHQRAWAARVDLIREFGVIARAEMAKTRRISAARQVPTAETEAYSITDDARSAAIDLLNRTWGNPADASTYAVDEVAVEAEVSTEVAAVILSLFSHDLHEEDPADVVRDIFDGRSPLRTRPILRDSNGSFAVVHGGLLIPSVRERVEEALKRAGVWERYAKHRGVFLEDQALVLLGACLPGAALHKGFEYFVPNPAASSPELKPSSYTKLVEGDGLVVVDDIALVVEAKAGALTPVSRTGDPKRLASDLRKIVTSAAEQAERLRQRIVEDRGLRLRDGAWLDLDRVREIHTLAVSLDDLSGIATITSELVLADLLPESNLPWTVSLHDLRIVTELVERPAELILYLRRRTEPEMTRRFHAVDELDFFLEFYNSGLFVEPDPDRVAAELPQFGEPDVASKRRFEAQGLTFLTSRTDQLDAWYFAQLGYRKAAAPKPALNSNKELLKLVDALAAAADPGWLNIGATLLDASDKLQQKYSQTATRLLRLTAKDGRSHSLAFAAGSRSDYSFVLIWATLAPNESVRTAETHLREYVSAKKHQVQAAFAVGFLFDSSSSTEAKATFYDNRVPGPDATLDEGVALLGLQPVARNIGALPPHILKGKGKRRPGPD